MSLPIIIVSGVLSYLVYFFIGMYAEACVDEWQVALTGKDMPVGDGVNSWTLGAAALWWPLRMLVWGGYGVYVWGRRVSRPAMDGYKRTLTLKNAADEAPQLHD